MSPRATTWLAWSLCGISLALTALGLLFLALNLSRSGVHVFDYWVEMTVIAVTFSTVGAVIAPRRPDNPIAWLFCAIGLFGGARLLGAEYATYALLVAPGSPPGSEALAWISFWLWVPHTGLLVFLALLFPDGRLPTPRWRHFAWVVAVVVVVGTFAVAFSPGTTEELGPIRNPLGIEGALNAIELVEALIFALALVAAASLFARLRRAGGGERQQLKWFAYAAAVAASGAIITYVVSPMIGAAPLRWAGFFLVVVGLAGIPIAVGIAILRYRLWDIDRLINRTLVYGLLTAALAVVYFGSVVVLQAGFRALTGGTSQLAVVISTLTIAALFSPLRRRVQAIIDRRFYRKKYDAAKTLADFSARLRNETDLDTLSDDLVAVVRETMQPEHVGLWLQSPRDRVSYDESEASDV